MSPKLEVVFRGRPFKGPLPLLRMSPLSMYVTHVSLVSIHIDELKNPNSSTHPQH